LIQQDQIYVIGMKELTQVSIQISVGTEPVRLIRLGQDGNIQITQVALSILQGGTEEVGGSYPVSSQYRA
jgi:hypothetical protein